MPDIRLRDYTARVQDLLRDARYDEVIGHCRNILSQYPRHIETYCQLGEACLEKGLYDQAKGFFQRALSADPENLMARVGLGLIEAERGTLPEAIWHMTRAQELAPGNAEVRQELRRLYLRRDGKEKGRIELTRGALGRLYARGALFPRAIAEFRAVLSDQPELVDIRVALAETLWREGRRLEAVETSLDLVEVLPDCLKANLILGEIWMRSGHTEAAEEKLDVVRALDPENHRAQEMMGRDSPLAVEDVWVHEPESASDPTRLAPPGAPPEQVVAPAAAATPAVLASVVEDVSDPGASGSDLIGPREEVMPAWLAEYEVPEEVLEPELVSEGEDEDLLGAEPPVPEWLRSVMAETDGAEGIVAQQSESPPERVDQVAPSVAHEVPDWLRELEVDAPAVAAGVAVGAAAGEALSDDDDMPQETAVNGVAPSVETLRGESEPVVMPSIETVETLQVSPEERLAGEGVTEPGSTVPAESGTLAELRTEDHGAEDDDRPQWVRDMEAEVAAGASSLGLDEAAILAAATPFAMTGGPAEGDPESGEEMAGLEGEPSSWVDELQAIAASKETGPAPEDLTNEVQDSEPMLPQPERPARLEALAERLESDPADYAARMELARLHRENGDWESALGHYEELIVAGERIPGVIADMQRLVGSEADQERLYRLMGDAYIKSNHLEEAAEMYRLAQQAWE